MQPDNSESWFQKLNERLDNEPVPSAEEIERIRAERNAAHEAIEGTSKESAFMDEDRSVNVRYWSCKDGVIGDGWDVAKPEDAHYQEVCAKHHLKKPGDSNTITSKWIDGKWIEKPAT